MRTKQPSAAEVEQAVERVAANTEKFLRCVTHLAVMFGEVPIITVEESMTQLWYGVADVALFLYDDGAIRIEFHDCHNPPPERRELCAWAEFEQLECPWCPAIAANATEKN